MMWTIYTYWLINNINDDDSLMHNVAALLTTISFQVYVTLHYQVMFVTETTAETYSRNVRVKILSGFRTHYEYYACYIIGRYVVMTGWCWQKQQFKMRIVTEMFQ